jgi:hypothetical protein
MLAPAVQVGRYGYGPKCARVMDLVEPKIRAPSLLSRVRVVRADDRQGDLFTGLMA